MEGQGALHESVVYPVSDGMPMGETDQHIHEMVDFAINVLLDHFRGTPGVYVAGNNFLYYEERDPRTVVSPDTYVVKGVEQRMRDVFKVWEEGGHAPCFVLEITSKSTRRSDLGAKMSRYRDDLGVGEYFLFDPRAEWIQERLRGFRLEGPGLYQPVTEEPGGRLRSEELQLELGVEDGHLRFYLPGAAAPLPTRAERAEREAERAEREAERAEREEERAERAERELERLRRELDRSG